MDGEPNDVTRPAPNPAPHAGVTLRDPTEADLPTFFLQQIDPEATAMAAFRARNHDAFMAHWAKILGDETITKKTILAGGRIAGNIVAFQHGGEPHVGYWIGKEFWGRGVATAALSAFLELVRTRPLHARVARHNIASIRVLEKCGFTMRDDPRRARAGSDVEELAFELGATRTS
jgi:RimJ/RimL family protein N-acetyltransferase